MRKSILALLIAGLLAVVGLVSCTTSNSGQSGDTATAEASASPSAEVTVPADRMDQIAPADARAITDPANPEATLVLFTDYQCPYCAQMDSVIQEVKDNYGDRVRILVRNYPLPKHANAAPAAQAAEAAAEQGAFEEMSASIFEHQQDWKTLSAEEAEDLFVSYAEDLGLDTEKFRTDYSSEEIKNRVNKDLQDSQDLQLPGTPSLILDNRILELDAVDYGAIQEQLDAALPN
ncbi:MULTISPECIES: thioredoxin domain-containing protein [unclassified Arthrobacter]|uniref:DsbA family protein n=1 Tax=unclassified Arthrobacter TaxID=235627 RepID=UPI001E5F6D10|nr:MULTISPECIES: thioredoxin domain-containing protein [unclassified Arthrobacter]MCC9146859.1 thioredoxin domain-containing protein [Arthrobacter sp. zg-Y919]MDK1278090.1 thioredoxin domain-containing protein [Arthrobacter sp. zg.Y919]WIB03324.1 thioredoxin domain-containing protein [Arthrobacter sp. zg-Y919]